MIDADAHFPSSQCARTQGYQHDISLLPAACSLVTAPNKEGAGRALRPGLNEPKIALFLEPRTNNDGRGHILMI